MKQLPLFSLFLIAFLSLVIVLHANTSSSYPIGSVDQPVTALEYCTFLSDNLAVQSDETAAEDFIGSEIPSIISTGALGKYEFSVITTAFNEIIPSVPSLQAQSLFNTWRENPTVKELLSYLNDKTHIQLKLAFPSQISPWSHTSYATDLMIIASNYPFSTLIPQLDTLVNNYFSGSSYSFLSERGLIVGTLTRMQLLSMERSFSSYSTITNYHRPTLATKDGLPLL